MKGGIVSMLYGAVAARELGLLDEGRIGIHLVCDEETGSSVGSGQLRERNLIDPNALAMLTAEQSGEVIWNAAKGALSLRVDVHGRPAHVGEAVKGVNSFLHMIKVATPLDAYVREMSERGSMIVVGGRSGGGSNFNVVPERTWFTLDGRFNPDVDLDAELARITALVGDAARAAGADVSVEVTQLAPPADTSAGHPAATLLGRCVADVTGRPASFELCAGCLDTRWYAQLGIPSFGFGPGVFEVSHGPAEYVDEAAMRRVAAVYARFAGELLAAR
jgi:acetylornithine deacetylase/succinyl-diaminopimelate desuccinylase-like protein